MIKRILMTTDTVGGVWTYSLELARSLVQKRVEVVLATMGRRLSEDQAHEAERVPGLHLFESEYKLEWMQDPWHDVERAGHWLLSIEQRTKPDLVHLNGFAHGTVPFQSPKIAAAHSCVLSWWNAVKGEDAPAEWNRYRAEVRSGLEAVDCVVAPSNFMLGEVRRLYGISGPTRVIYNARSGHAFPPKDKAPYIIAAGRMWDEGKNLRALEKVAGSLAWPVYVAGEQPQNHSSDNGEDSGGIRFLGSLAPRYLAFWFGRASIYCHPAKYEPFGLSVLEAALAGCALVLADTPSLREIWDDTALYVDPDDSAGLARALDRLAGDPTRMGAMARRSRFRALQYAPERMAEEYLEVYHAALPVPSEVKVPA